LINFPHVSYHSFILFGFIFCIPAVQSIKKQNLVEVRSMTNPPPAVKLALESICLLLGEFTTEWKVIRSVLMRDNFISTIVNFQTDDIT
jgi:dynein heavy chain 1